VTHTLVYLVTEDWYFWSHRRELAAAALADGWQVVVATRVTDHGDRIRAAGFELVPLGLERRSRSLIREMRAVLEIWRLYRRLRPAVVHHVALKPTLYGTLAARLAGVPRIVNAMAGLGFVFSSRRLLARLLRPAVTLALHGLLASSKVRMIVQNGDDRDLMLGAGLIAAERLSLIRGSGVDPNRLPPLPEPPADGQERLLAVCAARLLHDKGIGELVAAARLLRQRGIKLRIAIVGDGDDHNPSNIATTTLAQWQAEGVVEFWGYRDDIAAVWAEAHIAVLPSYREGLPKALLEAASCQRALVATDVPGCREICRDGETGLLVQDRDPHSLADALARLTQDSALRHQLAAGARQALEQDFALAKVISETLALYR